MRGRKTCDLGRRNESSLLIRTLATAGQCPAVCVEACRDQCGWSFLSLSAGWAGAAALAAGAGAGCGGAGEQPDAARAQPDAGPVRGEAQVPPADAGPVPLRDAALAQDAARARHAAASAQVHARLAAVRAAQGAAARACGGAAARCVAPRDAVGRCRRRWRMPRRRDFHAAGRRSAVRAAVRGRMLLRLSDARHAAAARSPARHVPGPYARRAAAWQFAAAPDVARGRAGPAPSGRSAR